MEAAHDKKEAKYTGCRLQGRRLETVRLPSGGGSSTFWGAITTSLIKDGGFQGVGLHDAAKYLQYLKMQSKSFGV